MDPKPSFERIFRLTGLHLGAAGLGFFVAAWLFAPKPRQPAALSPRVVQILELRTQAHAVASAAPAAPASAGLGLGTAGAPGAASAASAVAPSAALARATELCKALAWPACDPESVRAMGKLP